MITDTKTTLGVATQLSLIDATGIAQAILSEALEFCASKLGLEDPQAAAEHLHRRSSDAYNYFQYGLAKSVAEHLSEVDESVKAVFLYEEEATPDDLCFGQAKRTPLIHLIVWAEVRTAALQSLLTGLDRALVQMVAEILGYPKLLCVLDAQVIDDTDVENRTGYGALLSSLYHRPLEVWKRS